MRLDSARTASHHERMSENLISATVYMSRDQRDQLKKLSESTRVPMAVYIRDGIAMVLAAHSKKGGKS